MNIKSVFPAIFAACILLGYGPVAFAETEQRAEPAGADDSDEIEGSWFEGAAAPEPDTAAEERAEDKIVEELEPVDPSETRPSPGQAQASETEPRSAADRCLISTIEAVLDVDREGRSSDVSIDVQGGVVSLRGTLADQAAVEQARTRIERVKGVTRVDASGLTASRTAQDKAPGRESAKRTGKEAGKE